MAGFVTTSALGLAAAGYAIRAAPFRRQPWLRKVGAVALALSAAFYFVRPFLDSGDHQHHLGSHTTHAEHDALHGPRSERTTTTQN